MLNASALPITGVACFTPGMLTGKELGAALEAAMERKQVRQHHVAAEFGIKQPSVSEWIKYGRIGKRHIPHLVTYFADVVGPEHWGLPAAWKPAPELSSDVLGIASQIESIADPVHRVNMLYNVGLVIRWLSKNPRATISVLREEHPASTAPNERPTEVLQLRG